jgi:anti-sigma regulatory factor (Ser/Thr protein kinase)
MILSAAQDQRAVLARTTPLNLGPIDTSPGTARASARAQLSVWGRPDLVDDAEAVVSELVTNAVQASERGATPVELRMILTTRSVFVEVFDSAPGHPAPRVAGPAEESGRGLRLVTALSADFGWNPTSTGKVVWAEIGRCCRSEPPDFAAVGPEVTSPGPESPRDFVW